MKKLITITSLIAMGTWMTACGFSADPLKDYPDEIRNGIPMTKKPEKPKEKPISSDGLRVLSDDELVFQEGKEATYIVKGRAALPKEYKIEKMELIFNALPEGMTAELIVPEDPKAVKSNEVIMQLTWSPDKGTTGDRFYVRYEIEAQLIVNAGKIVTLVQPLEVTVAKTVNMPEIKLIEGLDVPVKENSQSSIFVEVYDPDGGTRAPEVIVVPQDSEVDLSRFIQLDGSPKKTSTGFWRYRFFMNLKDQELTKTSAYYTAKFRAYSSFGVPSMDKTKNVEVISQVKAPRFSNSLLGQQEFTIGSQNIFTVTINAPNDEGAVFADFTSDAKTKCQSENMTCSCTEAVNSVVQTCTVKWNVDAAKTEGEVYTLDLEAKNSGWVPAGSLPTANEKTGKTSIQIVLKK